jgi:hypothetical protein
MCMRQAPPSSPPPQALLDVSDCFTYKLIYQPVLAEDIQQLPALFMAGFRHILDF